MLEAPVGRAPSQSKSWLPPVDVVLGGGLLYFSETLPGTATRVLDTAAAHNAQVITAAEQLRQPLPSDARLIGLFCT